MALTFKFKADGTGYTRGLEKMRQQTKSWAGGIKGMIVGAFAATAAVKGLKDIITAASGLAETMSKSRVVFGRHAKAVQEWADGMSSSFGQSKEQALEAASTFASMFHVLGVGGKDSVIMSKRLTELASDMASFHNTRVEDAILAIGSGLRGEAEPLRKFNVLLNDATLKQEAMNMGLYSGKGALDLSAKSLAAYNVILNQTEVAHGDFSETSDQLANSTRIMKAQIADTAAEIGDSLIPAVMKLMGVWKAAQILFNEDGLTDKMEIDERAKRTGTAQHMASKGMLSGFSEDDVKILVDVRSSMSDLDNVMNKYGMTVFDFHQNTIEWLKAEENTEKSRAESAAERQKQIKETIEWEKKLAEEKEKRSRNVDNLRKEQADADFENLSDEDKEKKLKAERVDVEKTIKFRTDFTAYEGGELEHEEALLEAKKRRREIDKELVRIAEKRSDAESKSLLAQIDAAEEFERKKAEAEEKRKAEEKEKKDEAKRIRDAQDNHIITSSLASVGGGGNVSAYIADPALSEAKRQTKTLERIERKLQPAGGVEGAPEL